MENLEQPKIEMGSNEFGKFKDAESLLKAYNSLEAEFTKKSQRLSALESENVKTQNELTKRAENDKKIEEFVTKFEAVKPFSSALKETLTASENANLEEEAIRMLSTTYKTAEDYSKDSEFLNIYSDEQEEQKINLSVLRFKQFAQSHNERMKNKGVESEK